jgi:IS30 family transposase
LLSWFKGAVGAITDLELRMTINTLAAKGRPKRAIARQLDLAEGTVRYHLRRQASGAQDGRAGQPHRAGRARDAIHHWLTTQPQRNLAGLHAWLVAKHGYDGSLRSV